MSIYRAQAEPSPAGICCLIFGLVIGAMIPDAQAQSPTTASISPIALTTEPNLGEVEQALADAAWEFAVPIELLAVVAHTESHWRHRPARVSPEGRRGLLALSPNRAVAAAQQLGVSERLVHHDLVTHTRAFALLLDSQRPPASLGLGPWREALAWTLELSSLGSDQLIDRWFSLLDQGVIGRLESGEPVSISPTPIDADYLGLFAASMGNQARSSDYPPALWNPADTSNYRTPLYPREIGDVDMVVIHTVEGSYAGTISWFQNSSSNVSSHYVVGENGAITQMVLEEDIGWHISACNGHAIGIEHEGYAADLWHPDAMYQASAALTADILADWNIPADRDHVVGHSEVQSLCNTTHTDPGAGWDWAYYMSLIGGDNTVDLTELVGYIRHTDLYDSSAGITESSVTIDGHGTTTTDSTGYYVFDEIPPGTWDVCASASGYDTACRSKTVQADVTNWASILLDQSNGDDDDTSGDDDDTSGDDDDTSGDDDDTSGDDDDTIPADMNEDPESDWADDDDSRSRERGGCQCSSSTSNGESNGWTAILWLLPLLFRARRGRHAQS